MNDHSQLPGFVAGFLLAISGVSGAALLIKAWIGNVPPASANILWPVFVAAPCAGVILNPGVSPYEQIFLGLLGAVARLSLIICAIFNTAQKVGRATMFSLFIVSLGGALILHWSPL